MKRFALALGLLLSANAFASPGGFVGNPGDGIRQNGKLELRDLWSLELDQPYVGTKMDAGLPDMPALSFAYPKDLLAQKLSDANEFFPGLGDMLLSAMESYRWVQVDSPLTLIDDLNDPLALPADAEHVQIANRLGTMVRVNRAAFAGLDDVNKAALMIHEAAFSLVRPVSDAHGNLFQPASLARQLTGLLFSEPNSSTMQVAGVLKGFALPSEALPPSQLRFPAVWDLTLVNGKYPVFINSISLRRDAGSLKTAVAHACDRAASVAAGKAGSFEMVSLYRPKSFHLTFDSYQTTDGSEQSYLRVEAAQPELLDQPFTNAESCKMYFSLWAEKYARYTSW